MSLNFLDGQPFATGAVGYSSRPVTEHETASRLMLQVEIKGIIMTEAVVDTGGIYFLCTACIANLLDLNETESLGEETVGIRGSSIRGRLHRVNLKILAEEGNGAEIEVTAFIPQDTREERWIEQLPCFLGRYGCLERLRFAIDPASETFYFGPIS